jgi:hypothetical protein
MQNARPQECKLVEAPRIFFSIYYYVDDHAFRRAARTWKRCVKTEENFVGGVDQFSEHEVRTESGFKAAWKKVSDLANRTGGVVWVGQLFTHASKGSSEDGLEFKKSEQDDGTLTQKEIASLQKLPWDPEMGYLILSGCNTGKSGKRGWTPAEKFATNQKVLTVGQDGYGYFSKNWTSYSETSGSDSNIALWAYRRGKNSLMGNGGRVPGVIFRPPR